MATNKDLLDFRIIGSANIAVGGVFKESDASEVTQRIKAAEKEKQDRIKAYRAEASRKAAIANKRIKRLEENNLTDSPAYRGYIESGGGKFSVRGKSFNEVQAEVARINKLLDAKTSTVRGINTYLKQVADSTGIRYSNLKELRDSTPKFFELSRKVEEYLRQVDDSASAIGYQRIWEAINQYVQTSKTNLADAELSVDEMVEKITDALREYDEWGQVSFKGVKAWEGSNWFKLPKT